jgi:hypothetical protein
MNDADKVIECVILSGATAALIKEHTITGTDNSGNTGKIRLKLLLVPQCLA